MKTLWHLVLEADDTTESPQDGATDYGTDSPQDTEPEADNDQQEETEVDPEEDGATDYGEEAPADDGGSTNDDETTGTEDDSTDSSISSTPEETEDNKSNSVLIDDYLNVYYSIQSVINKLSTIDKSNMNINKVVSRVTSNLIHVKTELFNYIKYQFGKSNYMGNLMKYNYFIEAYRINIAILRKTKVFIPISQNNKVKNIRKEVR